MSSRLGLSTARAGCKSSALATPGGRWMLSSYGARLNPGGLLSSSPMRRQFSAARPVSSQNNSSNDTMLLESQQCAQRGDLSKAACLASTFLKEHKAHSLEAATYAALIEVFARAKRLDKANNLLCEMQTKGVVPSLAVYADVVRVANRPDTVSTADAIYDKLIDEGVTLDAQFYDAYISALVGARRFQRAHQIYFQMAKRQKLPATAVTYKNLITIYGESKRWDLVQDVLRKMVKRNVQPEPLHYGAAVLAVAKAKGIDDAFAWVDSLGVGHPAMGEQVYNSLVEACCIDAGTLDRSWRALRSMKKAGVRPSTRTYNAILAGHAKFGRSPEISTVLEEMATDGVPKDSYTFSLLVKTYAKAANMRKAFDLYNEYKANGFAPRPDICNHLLNGLRQQVTDDCGSDQVTEAIAQADVLFDEMVQADTLIDATGYYNLIQVNHLARNNAKALRLYNDMKQRGVRPSGPLVHLMGTIITQEMDHMMHSGHL